MKNRGFKNEQALIIALNGKNFDQLNKNLRDFIKHSFKEYEGIIHCKSLAGDQKSDIKVQIGNESHTYSVKMGKGNSIHQEPLEDFVDFLTKEHQLDAQRKNYLQAFIWGDGTNDGSGEIKNRISARKFKKQNPKKIKALQAYFNSIKRELIERFLIHGTSSSTSAEYLYYGTVKKGTLCQSEDVLNWLSKQKSRGVLNIGKLTLQAWNRNLKGKAKAEKKRGVVQIKWGGLKKDIRKIAKVNLGKRQEIDFVKELNQKEKLSYWQTLGIDPNNHHAIRVISQKYGKVNQRKVWAKADAFIAKGFIPSHYLKLNHYFLDENDVKKFKLEPIEKTGISIKQTDSKQYQILKMAPSTFEKLFGSNILAVGASIYYRKKKKLALNQAILKGWNISEEDFFAYYAEKLKLPINSVTHGNCQKCLKQIKRYAKKEIIQTIKANKTLSDFIFLGVGNFQEPFTAPWLFKEGIFQKNRQTPFSVTTGSGRSRGKYSIVIKPR